MPIMVLVWCRPGASVGTQITVTARPRQRRRPSCKKLAASPQLLGQHDRGQPHHGRRPGRMVPDQPVHQRGEQERRDAGPGPTHHDQPGHRPNQQQDRRLRAQAPQRRPGRGHAAQEKGAEGRSCRVVERQPEDVDACGGALATVRVELAGWTMPTSCSTAPSGAGGHKVLHLDLDLLADPPAMAPAILDAVDRGELDAEHLADQRAQPGHGPPSWPAKTAPSFSACSGRRRRP